EPLSVLADHADAPAVATHGGLDGFHQPTALAGADAEPIDDDVELGGAALLTLGRRDRVAWTHLVQVAHLPADAHAAVTVPDQGVAQREEVLGAGEFRPVADQDALAGAALQDALRGRLRAGTRDLGAAARAGERGQVRPEALGVVGHVGE